MAGFRVSVFGESKRMLITACRCTHHWYNGFLTELEVCFNFTASYLLNDNGNSEILLFNRIVDVHGVRNMKDPRGIETIRSGGSLKEKEVWRLARRKDVMHSALKRILVGLKQHIIESNLCFVAVLGTITRLKFGTTRCIDVFLLFSGI
ncbi:uncharacterized protein LOC112167671 [Rosa chinensis]|uniref:uncharacterized protein LOC112167671 n=1 Tax=Rosa chinensis TaxID=74649 RepID=UPI001AD8E800|nr:uncharacterized protein LOC112167671 [Rosa chinensis]